MLWMTRKSIALGTAVFICCGASRSLLLTLFNHAGFLSPCSGSFWVRILYSRQHSHFRIVFTPLTALFTQVPRPQAGECAAGRQWPRTYCRLRVVQDAREASQEH